MWWWLYVVVEAVYGHLCVAMHGGITVLELELESYLTWGAFSQEAILPGAHNTHNINTYQHTYST